MFWCNHDWNLGDKHESKSFIERMRELGGEAKFDNLLRSASQGTVIYTFKCHKCGKVKQKVHKV